jgi:hypothetical protein
MFSCMQSLYPGHETELLEQLLDYVPVSDVMSVHEAQPLQRKEKDESRWVSKARTYLQELVNAVYHFPDRVKIGLRSISK